MRKQCEGMAAQPQVDVPTCTRRLKELLNAWRASGDDAEKGFGAADALCIVRGSASDELHYKKSVALHLWLFGYEVPGTSRESEIVSMVVLPKRGLRSFPRGRDVDVS